MIKNGKKIIEGKDLSHLREEHVNKWVALSSDGKKVFASGDTVENVLHKIQNVREKIMFYRVLPPDLTYSPAEHEI